MHIAHLSTFYPFRGGIAQFNALLYRKIQALGHTVTPYTFTTQYPKFLFPGETQFVQTGDEVDAIQAHRILSSINPISYITAARRIAKSNPDILLMKYWMSFFGPSLGYVASKMPPKTKVITILDNVIPHEKKFFDKAFTKYFINKNSGFIAMSEKVKEDLLSFDKNAKVILLHHPLYEHFGKLEDKTFARKSLGLSPDKKTLLFFGFIRDYKGLDLLIDAFSKLDQSYQLLIAGESYGSFEKYNKTIEKNPLKNNIHTHIRYISDTEVSRFFSASDVCILPYKSATQSGITGISFFLETPIIATNVGGLAELVTHEKTGLIVETPKAESIAKSIKTFFEEHKSDAFLPHIKSLKASLSWDNFALKLISFISEIPHKF